MYPHLPKALILAGFSGVGKTTMAQYLLAYDSQFSFSVSACTRRKRPHEVNGKDYYFFAIEDFRQKITQQAFIEWEEVYENNYYGTLKAEVDRIHTAEKIAIFDTDIKGGLKLKSFFKENALAVYIKAPSTDVLLERLKNRNTEQEAEIARRMHKVEETNKLVHFFDDVLVNDSLENSKKQIKQLADFLLS